MLVVRRWVRDAGDPVNTYRKVLRLLTPRERKRGALVLGMVVIMALLETAGVASVAPFLSVLGNPSMVETNPILSRLYTGLGFASTDSFLMLLGAGAFALIVVAAGFRTLTLYAMNRYIQMRGHSLSERLHDASFAYPHASAPALRNIDTAVPVGTSLGLAGGTGAGKTTLVDIVLGLLPPSEGELLVDDTPIAPANLRAWQRALGYVPQEIFLTDSSVAENIALGIPAEDIDGDIVQRCGQMAQVHEFIMEELPRGYDTFVGERGVRLSGGQRQRIGIARALYHDPAVLVFDEATSALDTVTERAVMQAVKDLSPQKTIIIIAHRLSTVRDCDRIVLLEQGEIVAEGTFTELAQSSGRFRDMAEGLI